MKAGERIFVESLLTEQEWKECKKKYPSTYEDNSAYPIVFECEFKWRHGVGASLSKQEITLINKRLNEMLKKVSA